MTGARVSALRAPETAVLQRECALRDCAQARGVSIMLRKFILVLCLIGSVGAISGCHAHVSDNSGKHGAGVDVG